MTKKYFISYTVYAGFGNLTEYRETFATWSEMERCKRQLRKDQLVDFGEIATPQAMDRRAA